MSKSRAAALLSLCLAVSPLVTLLAGCSEEPLGVVSGVELPRFQGKWYEIAKLPRAIQSDCHGTTAFYSERAGGLDIVNECRLGRLDGELKSITARGEVPDPSVPAKLSVDFGGIFGDYWIIDLGEKYEFAVVGHPTRDYLWVLSRTPSLDEGTLTGILERAKANGFDTSRLEYTEQAPSAQ
jgi:apolipoprotein D and lipocalin family protein